MPDENKQPGGAGDNATDQAAGDSFANGDIAQLQADLVAAKEQITALTETSKRAFADLQNYRKRIKEEQTQFVQFANVNLILELLPILDNFNRAFSQVPDEVKKTDWFRGALQIEQQLIGIMKKQGVIEMEPAIGKQLDTRLHEAVAAGPGAKDTVIEEYEKGYLIGEKVIRPAKVKVGDNN